MKRATTCLILILLLSAPALAVDPGRFGIKINYGCFNNLNYWLKASSGSGTFLKLGYLYDFNDFYTAAVELGFFADQNAFATPSSTMYVETGSFVNINHIFRTGRIGVLHPYYQIGTGLYGVSCWKKNDTLFTIDSNDVTADINLGGGVDFNVWNVPVNVEMNFFGILHAMYFKGELPYTLSLGSSITF